MATIFVYLSAAVAFVSISLLLLVLMVRSSIDKDHLIATPNIPRENGVMTNFASIKVKGTVDEVFSVIKNYKGYSDWCLMSEYKWNDTDADGVPRLGSTGTFKLSIDDFVERVVPVKLTLLDHDRRRTAEMSIGYPKWLLLSERVQEILPVEGQPDFCEYRTYQTLEGIGAYYLLLAREDFYESLQRCATELKTFIEHGKR